MVEAIINRRTVIAHALVAVLQFVLAWVPPETLSKVHTEFPIYLGVIGLASLTVVAGSWRSCRADAADANVKETVGHEASGGAVQQWCVPVPFKSFPSPTGGQAVPAGGICSPRGHVPCIQAPAQGGKQEILP